MKRAIIVGCGKQKRDGESRAEDLYTSPYFAFKRQYAETFSNGKWFVASAKHGLLPHYREVEPYDKHIKEMDYDERVALFEHGTPFGSVTSAFTDLFEYDEVDVLAGKDYVKPIREACRNTKDRWGKLSDTAFQDPPTVNGVFQQANLGGMGEQISWMKTALRENLRQPGEKYNGQVGLDRYNYEVEV
ncbi:DUF6884 domain-containing protein [Halobium salinum]|uniref:DUF6884 domain-containing protein n=1 Tax=Halobium salinum TaxID=1364940 RepID=A0ABD5PEW4_9EURY|nr:DUF6884 domain-containing protein [Halobium salinum]